MIKFVKPNEEMIQVIADNMRHDDAEEVMLSHDHSPMEALMNSWKSSDYSVIITVDDEPVVMFGLVVMNIMTGTGVPWMLSSEKALYHKRELLKYCKLVVEDMLKVCPYLFNHVYTKNKLSVRWLKWLGFTIAEPEVYGVKQQLFHRFHLER